MTLDIDQRIDPELGAIRAKYPSLGFDLDNLSGSRGVMAKMAERAGLPDDVPVAIEVRTIAGPAGGPDLAVRIFRPAATDGLLPSLLWIHGGGFVLGTAADTDRRLGEIAHRLGCVVVSVDYRLAPENPYPAAVEDCSAALAWLFASAQTLAIDPARLAIGGASAGAGLAAAVALKTRDEGANCPIFQLLLYPMLDDRNDYPSSHGITDPTLWNRATNLQAWQMYLDADPGSAKVSPYAAPARAENLAGLPPAFIAVGDLDLFLDEDIGYAQRLLQAQVPTELHVYAGAIHGFDMLAPEADLSLRFQRDVESALGRALSCKTMR